MITFDFEAGRKELFPSGYTQRQVDSINAIVKECNSQAVVLKTQVAYIFATAYHECYDPRHPETRLTPMREVGGEAYLKSKKYYPCVGMGFSQLTWQENYWKEGKRMGIDLLSHPEKMLEIDTAANSHVFCIMNGTYTGVKLSKYVNSGKTDFPNARRVINGTDQAEKIAGYASKFLVCLVLNLIINNFGK